MKKTKKKENQLFLQNFFKNGHLEGKAYGESKKSEIPKKVDIRPKKHSSGLFQT